MGALPKRRISSHRQGKRRKLHSAKVGAVSICPNCGKLKRPHRECQNCNKQRSEVGGRRSEGKNQ